MDAWIRTCPADPDGSLGRRGKPRQLALDPSDAFGTKEKTLHASLGGHTGTPWFEVEDGARFFARHLK